MPDLNPQPLESQTAFAMQPNRLVTLLMQPAPSHRLASTCNNICIYLGLNVLESALRTGRQGWKQNY
jgi:hypothetical protein